MIAMIGCLAIGFIVGAVTIMLIACCACSDDAADDEAYMQWCEDRRMNK